MHECTRELNELNFFIGYMVEINVNKYNREKVLKQTKKGYIRIYTKFFVEY